MGPPDRDSGIAHYPRFVAVLRPFARSFCFFPRLRVQPPAQIPETAGLAALLLTALLVRLIPVLFVPSINWGDEIFQATEQAHRLVYGTGLVPWEFEFGIRSWLLPGTIAGLMEFARLFGDGPRYYLPVISLAFAGLAAAPVLCSYLWARRFFGLTGAFVAGAVVAVAPELVYFGARTLSGVVAGNLLVVALYLLEPGFEVASRRRLFAAGAILALVLVLRLQLAPALGAIGLWAVWGDRRGRILALITGAGVVLASVAVLDTVTLGYPFAAMWRYFSINAIEGVSATFGVKPWDFYFLLEYGVWGMAVAVPLLLAALGARRMPLLALCAIIILAVHSAVPHKEYRFIYPAILLIMILAGLGLADCARLGADRLKARGARTAFAPVLVGVIAAFCWLAIAARVWEAPNLTALRLRDHYRLLAALFVADGPVPCGIGVYGPEKHGWVASGGYTYLQQPVPLYWPADGRALRADARAFDTLVYRKPPPRVLDFKTLKCFGPICVARRSGVCRPVPMAKMPIPQPLASFAEAKGIPVPAIPRSAETRTFLRRKEAQR